MRNLNINSVLLRSAIEHEIEYMSSKDMKIDRLVLKQMLNEINRLGFSYKYKSELIFDTERDQRIGLVVKKYITDFVDAGIKAELLSVLIKTKVPDLDLFVLSMYQEFKNSDEYLVARYVPVFYDDAFRRLKSKRISDQLLDLSKSKRDALYLPFTMYLLAKWKCEGISKTFINYIESDLTGMEQLYFTAIKVLSEVGDNTSIEVIRSFSNHQNKDLRDFAKKKLKKLGIDIFE